MFCFRRGAERLRRIEELVRHNHHILEKVMASLEDVQNSLNGISDGVAKIATETQGLLDKIAQLQAANPDQQAQIDALAAQAQAIADKVKAVDDLVPDTPVVVDNGGTEQPTGDETQSQ
jgi:uncharacterized protein YoxC